MKVLIIADNLGNNAPGVVFRNILAGLSKKMEFDSVYNYSIEQSSVLGNIYGYIIGSNRP